MSPFDQVKSHISKTVPYARYTGVQIVSVADGRGETLLPQQDVTLNHIGSQHAGALFTLGEAASGAAMAGGFLPVLASVRPVAANACIQYVRIAKGPIRAVATLSKSVGLLIDQLNAADKVQFQVNVVMHDESDSEVATMQVDWHLSKVAGT